MAHPSAPILAMAGIAGSGKSTIARALAEQIPNTKVIHLDHCYHTDPERAPSVPVFDGVGRIVDFSDPAALDPNQVTAAITNATQTATLVVVEGTFALTLPDVRNHARWGVYIHTPPDIGIARKTLRKISEGRNPVHVLRGYLTRGRDAQHRYILPTREHADLVLDGTRPVHEQTTRLRAMICL